MTELTRKIRCTVKAARALMDMQFMYEEEDGENQTASASWSCIPSWNGFIPSDGDGTVEVILSNDFIECFTNGGHGGFSDDVHTLTLKSEMEKTA